MLLDALETRDAARRPGSSLWIAMTGHDSRASLDGIEARLSLRVLTWNLFHGRSLPPAGRSLLDEFARALARWEWDVALLQEMPPWWGAPLAARTGASAFTTLTSRNCGRPLRRALADRWPDLMRSNGGGANAVLTRTPMMERRALRLRRWPERRAGQLARLASRVCVVNTHLSTRPELAREELARLWQAAHEFAGASPLVLGGDLNLRASDPGLRAPETGSSRDLASRRCATHERAVHVAARDVDHVFALGAGRDGPAELPSRGVTLDGAPLELSDHPPLLVALQIPACLAPERET